MTAAEPRASQATRDRLLKAAESLFLDYGYDGTSARMITAEARANLAAINYHFGGKEELFQAMLARRLDDLHTLEELVRRDCKLFAKEATASHCPHQPGPSISTKRWPPPPICRTCWPGSAPPRSSSWPACSTRNRASCRP